MRRKLIPTIAVAALAISVAACSGGDDDDESSGSTTTTEAVDETTTTAEPEGSGSTSTSNRPAVTTTVPQTTTTESSAVCAGIESWNTKPDVELFDTFTPGRVLRANTARHDRCDRVVFDIRGDTAGFDVRYLRDGDVVREDGSGRPAPVDGGAVLQVIIYVELPPQSAVINDTPGFPALKQVRSAGWFEANQTIALGTADELSFRAFLLGPDPTEPERADHRVVIDIAHG